MNLHLCNGLLKRIEECKDRHARNRRAGISKSLWGVGTNDKLGYGLKLVDHRCVCTRHKDEEWTVSSIDNALWRVSDRQSNLYS